MNTKKRMLAGVHNEENPATISFSIDVIIVVKSGFISAEVIASKTFTSMR